MKKIVITMLVLLSAAYAVGIGGGEVARKLNLRPSQIVPAADTLPVRNLIYLIGDGMGLSHVSMLMLEEGYGTTAFDRAQNIALITTYSANNRVTDSAAAGTALATGHKTGNGMLGVLPDSTAAESIMADAIRAGMPTGVVVTSTLQHATPGAFYAHVPYRRQYQRISDQLAGSDLTVAFGGGLKYAEASEREDGVPGIERLRDRGFRVLTDPSQLDTLSRGPVMGFFADGHLPKMSEGRGDYLERAIRKALEILSREAGERDRGFILMVEGSQIDLRAHDNDAEGVLAEMRDFDRAVAAAMDFADRHPGTLVVVTADHETGGLSIPSADVDFEHEEAGIEYRFSTGGHTAAMVPVYLYGTGSERINGVLDNTELARMLKWLVLPDSGRIANVPD